MKRSTARETSLYGATAPMTTRAHTQTIMRGQVARRECEHP